MHSFNQKIFTKQLQSPRYALGTVPTIFAPKEKVQIPTLHISGKGKAFYHQIIIYEPMTMKENIHYITTVTFLKSKAQELPQKKHNQL